MNKKLVFFIIIILILAFLVRVIPIRTAHWWDETVYLQNAEVLFSGRTNYDEFSFRPPLLSVLFFLVFFIKHSPISASILTAAISTLAPLFAFLIGKKLYGLKTGIIAGLILAFSPIIALHSNFLLTDVPVITLLGASFYLSLFREKKILLFLSGVIFSLAILMKFTAALMVFVFLLYFFFRKFKLKEVILFVAGFTIIFLPYLIWSQVQFGNFLTPFIKGSQMVSDKNESLFFYFKNIPKAFTILVPIGIVLWFVNSLIQIKNKKYKNFKKDLIMLFWVIVFLAYLTLTPHKEIRYIFPIAIPIILLASQGFSLLIKKIKNPYKISVWIILSFYLLFLISSTYAYESFAKSQLIDYSQTDEMKIADYLKEINYTGVIYSNQRWPVLAYYTGLETRQLYPYDLRFYSEALPIMEKPGLLIGMFGVKEPQPRWLDKNSHFKYVNEIGDFFIYEYLP